MSSAMDAFSTLCSRESPLKIGKLRLRLVERFLFRGSPRKRSPSSDAA